MLIYSPDPPNTPFPISGAADLETARTTCMYRYVISRAAPERNTRFFCLPAAVHVRLYYRMLGGDLST